MLKTKMVRVPLHHCPGCQYEWVGRLPTKPKRCPNCKRVLSMPVRKRPAELS